MSGRVYPEIVRHGDRFLQEKICRDRRIVFHHIPKTAGSTFRKILESYYDLDEICTAEIDEELYQLTGSELNRYKLYAGHFSHKCIAELFPDDYWLTFIRNPVSRVVSNYFNNIERKRVPDKWWKRFSAMPDGKVWTDVLNIEFEEYLRNGNLAIQNILNNYQTWLLVDDGVEPFRMGRRRTDKIAYDLDVVNEAKKNLKDNYAFVGVQEEFDLSLQLFAYTFGERPIPVSNDYTRNINVKKSVSDVYEKYHTEIADRNQMDYELWEFSKELLQARVSKMQQALVKTAVNSEGVVFGKMLTESDDAVRSIVDVENTRGFYWLERSGDIEFKWTGYERPSRIELFHNMVSGRAYAIEVNVLSYIDETTLRNTSVSFDGVRLELVGDSDSGRFKYVGKYMPNGECIYNRYHSIDIDGPIRQPNKEDERMIGLAINEIKIAAVRG